MLFSAFAIDLYTLPHFPTPIISDDNDKPMTNSGISYISVEKTSLTNHFYLIIPVFLLEQLSNEADVLESLDDLRRVVESLNSLVHSRIRNRLANVSAHSMRVHVQRDFPI